MSSPKVSCDICTAPCCKAGVNIELRPNDVAYFLERGSNLERRDGTQPPHHRLRKLLPLFVKGPDSAIADGVAEYMFKNDCPNLVVQPDGATICSQHDNNRPEACVSFEPGSYYCRLLRARAGLMDFVEIGYGD